MLRMRQVNLYTNVFAALLPVTFELCSPPTTTGVRVCAYALKLLVTVIPPTSGVD